MTVESLVQERYAEGAAERQEALCCPVDYDAGLLKMLPQEIIDKDYGCGAPSRYVQEGDVVIDLGSGGGKICYMAAQLVGAQGRVIGVDMTDDMLALARKYQVEMSEKTGARVEFKKGYIQDLALSVDALEQKLTEQPVASSEQLQVLESWKEQQRRQQPMIASDSATLVISNCVLNLVDNRDRQQMIAEIFRVLKPGGRVAISDIVCDEVVPQHLQSDSELWSSCISGAFQERDFLQAFIDAGFVAVAYDKCDEEPWQVVEGIEFRSVTLVATKAAAGPLVDVGQAVIYKGTYSSVSDDLGNCFPRGLRIAVSQRSCELLANGPYANDFIVINPAELVECGCFCLPAGTERPASESKGGKHGAVSKNPSSCC